jgi:hypothetical protein
MDDTLVYMSTANAIRANNMSATNMCAARNIVTSADTIEKQYEYMYEEHSDEYMDDTNKQYEERSDETHTRPTSNKRANQSQGQ